MAYDKVRIAPYNYEIRFVEELKNDDGEGLYGQIDYAKCVIRIREEYKDSQRLPYVVMHEILHGIIEAAGSTEDDDERKEIEKIITILAPGVIELIRNNRWIVDECLHNMIFPGTLPASED